MEILLAIVIGAAFGAALDLVGAANPNWIGRMLALRHLHLMKAILLAIGTGSVLMFGGQMLGLVDVGHMSVKAAYIGVFVGGLLLGIGWAASGFCPGTGVAAAGAGRKDAMVFIVGGLAGAAAYMATFPAIEATGLLNEILGGETTLGAVPGADYPALLAGLRGDVAGILMGVLLIAVAFLLPEQPRTEAHRVPAE